MGYVHQVIFESDTNVLTQDVFEVEVKRAAFELGRDKPVDLDGFSGVFFQSCWDHIRHNMVRMVRSFLKGEVSIGPLNETNIVLIPKIDNPEWVHQFLPISLCNFVYQIIFKLLVNRMKNLLLIISEHSVLFFLID